MKLGIVGSRQRNSPEDKELIKQKIQELSPDLLVSGGCWSGADRFAVDLSKELSIPIKEFRPNLEGVGSRWQAAERYYIRNKKIALYSDVLIAVVSPERKGGTENTIKYFIENKSEENLILL